MKICTCRNLYLRITRNNVPYFFIRIYAVRAAGQKPQRQVFWFKMQEASFLSIMNVLKIEVRKADLVRNTVHKMYVFLLSISVDFKSYLMYGQCMSMTI